MHPTPAGHQIIAEYAIAEIEAPQQIGLLAEAPLQVEQANFRALDSRMLSGVGAPRAQNKFDTYAIYDYGNYDRSGDAGGGRSYTNTVLLGGDMKVSDRMLVGLAFGYTDDKSSLGSNAGSFKLEEATLTAYAGYGDGPWYVGALWAAAASIIATSTATSRSAPSTRTETGATNGSHFMARAARRILVQLRELDSRSVPARDLPAGHGRRLGGDRHKQHRDDLRPAGAQFVGLEPGLAGGWQSRLGAALGRA